MGAILNGFNKDGVDFKILHVTGPDFSVGPGARRAVMELQFAYADWEKAKRALLGWPEIINLGGTWGISRHLPHNIAEIYVAGTPGPSSNPAVTNMWATSITRTRPVAPQRTPDANGISQFPFSILQATVNYESRPYPIRPDFDGQTYGGGIDDSEAFFGRYVQIGQVRATQKIDRGIGNHFIFLNEGGFPPGPGEPIRPVTTGTLYPFFEVFQEIIWHDIPINYAPVDLAARSLGSINITPFWRWNPRQVMLANFHPEFVELPHGAFAYRMRYDFAIHPVGWDMIRDPTRGGQYFRAVARDNYTKIMFPETEFRNLFRPVQLPDVPTNYPASS